MSDALWHASALDAQTAVLWQSTPSGAALIADDTGRPYTAPDVGTLVAHAPEPAVAVALTPSERVTLLEALHAATPERPRWHVSPIPGARVPMAFAWYGPDELNGRLPEIMTRGRQYALWPGGSPEDAVARGLAALAARQVSAVAAPCPPEAETLSRRVAAPAIAVPTR
jgi:hypothetical protein